jgi:hypothetical protein
LAYFEALESNPESGHIINNLAESTKVQSGERGIFVVRITLLRLSILGLVVVTFLAVAPAASANTITFDLTQNNLGGLNGTSIGTVKLTDSCGNTCVNVTISMLSGFGVFMNNQNGKGGDIFLTTPATLTQSSLVSLSSGMVTGFRTGGTRGGFTFNFDFNVAGGTSPSTLTFTLHGVTTGQISSLGFHFICLTGNCPGSTTNTGFVQTGPPVTTVPEPGTLGLLGTGLFGIAVVVRRRLTF